MLKEARPEEKISLSKQTDKSIIRHSELQDIFLIL